MSIKDWFKKKQKYETLNVEFTQEEAEAMQNALDEFWNISGSSGKKYIYPEKVILMIQAQGLSAYVVQLYNKSLTQQGDAVKNTINKAITVKAKAYGIYNLPTFLYQIALFYEYIGDIENAKKFYRNFLTMHKSHQYDQIDTVFLQNTEFNMELAVRESQSKQ
jgi:hypothetical protein